jgi:hypothetical protein
VGSADRKLPARQRVRRARGFARPEQRRRDGRDQRRLSERRDELEEEREGLFTSERTYGSFCRVVPLPEGAIPDSGKASFKDGVLEVTVEAPPGEVSRGRRIDVSGG